MKTWYFRKSEIHGYCGPKKKATMKHFHQSLFPWLMGIALLSFSCADDHSDHNNPTPTGSNILKGTIKTDMALVNSSADIDYYVEEIVYMEAKMTIEPGTVIVGKAGSGIVFSTAKGVLVANGTKALPIVFKSESGAKGGWLGIRFDESNNPLNSLKFVTIADGGASSFDGDNTRKANLQFYGTNQVQMKGCQIRNSAAHGIFENFNSNLTIIGFDSNRFESNTDFPILMYDQNARSLGLGNEFPANGRNFIGLRQKEFTGLPGNHTWKKHAVPYYWEDNANLVVGYYDTNGSLTLEAGVQLIMGPGTGIVVGDNANTTGWLKMTGSGSEKIRIRGESNVAGFWKGILIRTNSVNNDFLHAIIGDAGSTNLSLDPSKANIVVDTDSRLKMANVELVNSAGCGYTYRTDTSDPATVTVSGMTYSANNSGNVCTY
jgi:polygalacturonase